MKISPSTSLNIALAAILIASLLFIGTARNTNSAEDVEAVTKVYDPWSDFNDDGLISIKDLVHIISLYGTAGDPAKPVTVAGYNAVKWNISFTMGWYETRSLVNNTAGYRQITIIFRANFWDTTVKVAFHIQGSPFQVDSFGLSPNTYLGKTYEVQGEIINVTATTIDSGGSLYFAYYMTP